MEQMQEQLLQLIDAMKDVAPLIWETYVKQALIKGWGGLFVICGFTILHIVWSVPAVWWASKNIDNKIDSDLIAFIYAVCVVLTGILFIAILICTIPIATQILNPEYHAIHMLLEDIKP